MRVAVPTGTAGTRSVCSPAAMVSTLVVGRVDKELVIGRRLAGGAPLTGEKETDEPDFTGAVNEVGLPI
ncbi:MULTISPECIES: hypothetical protein [unclassified Micromonospora]|uniref:hypothetical protein n=1 Tax=unclassified Micromonospora TaxID=2617518 RepID=UPI003A8981E5